ncbi:MAG: DUF1223 domain-containing protein [Ideonella sp.]|nr:DUF1223 domain-containing protein [Ideonella sp.]MCC7455635.1 DUF1223 domain-containing protein [Nitrospira sp.]
MNRLRPLLPLCLAASIAAPQALAQRCSAESGAHAPLVVELYTSEGCNSCPPADRWLSSLVDQPGVLAAAFHVDYWDRLGWVDRFASARHSERQAGLQAAAGSRFAYTPQVLVNGRDWRRWPRLPQSPTSAGDATPPRLSMRRVGDDVELHVQPVDMRPGGEGGSVARSAAPARWSLWWAALEDGHVSTVAAGENAGATLHHDAVVRHYGTVAPWSGSLVRHLAIPARGEGGRAPRVIAVVVDAASGATLQALQLRCAP